MENNKAGEHTQEEWVMEERQPLPYQHKARYVVKVGKHKGVIATTLHKERALLIAAAPDMLKALEMAEIHIKNMEEELNATNGVLVDVQAAINKAKGQ